MKIDQAQALKDFRRIPGVGKSIARDFWAMGFRCVGDLCGRDPEVLYRQFCELRGEKVCRCMLYVFRSSVYFAETPTPDPQLVDWWAWKDSALAQRKR